jgi:hypothetical protein
MPPVADPVEVLPLSATTYRSRATAGYLLVATLMRMAVLFLIGGCMSHTSDPGDQRCTTDSFAAPAIDTRIWGIYEQPPTTVETRDGQLVITLADDVAGYASVYSLEELDFRDTAVAVEVVGVPDGIGAEALLQWVVNDRYRHYVAVEDGRLVLGIQEDDTYEALDLAYDPIEHRHWRLRHDADRDRISYETSADRTTWDTRHVTTRRIPLDQAYVELAGGSYLPVASAGLAVFDNFELSGRCEP